MSAANWVSFDFNVSYSSCWGYSLINTFKLKKCRLLVRNRVFRAAEDRTDKEGLLIGQAFADTLGEATQQAGDALGERTRQARV